MPSKEMKKKIGSLFLVGFQGRNISKPLKEMITKYHVGGLVFFSRNVSEPKQVWELIRSLKQPGLLFSIDHEGGRVNRLPEPVTQLPPAGVLGRHHSPEIVRKAAEIQGWELAALGFNYSFAPVVDVWTNPNNRVIGDRAYSSDPHEVATLAMAALQGLQEAGVVGCAKHFPGHGDTRDDSHKVLPRVSTELKMLNEREWVPFRHVIQGGVRSIMVGHLLMEHIDPTLPASLSKAVVDGILRKKLGFQGVVVSDDYEMEGVKGFPVEERVLLALQAGVDQLMFCHSPDVQVRAIETLYKALDGGILKEERILEAHARIMNLKRHASHVVSASTPEELQSALTMEDHKRFATSMALV